MSAPDDQLSRVLRGAAEGILGQPDLRGPDADSLWREGRRVTWAARVAAGGLVAAVVLMVLAMVLVVRPAPASLPADGGDPAYPTFISDLFPGGHEVSTTSVFALVDGERGAPGQMSTYVVTRGGGLDAVHPADVDLAGAVLAPDGLHALTEAGIVDLTDGYVGPLLSDSPLRERSYPGRAVWSPDSAHVAVDTVKGPVVVDLFSDAVVVPTPDDAAIRVVGWSGPSTVLGVLDGGPGSAGGLKLLSRQLGAARWVPTGTVIAPPSGVANARPTGVWISPDGSRVLLDYDGTIGAGGRSWVVVDTATGMPLPLAGTAAPAVLAWDQCAPVWRDDRPLLAHGGVTDPVDGSAVIAFAGRIPMGCVQVAGADLTGRPDPSTAAHLRERAYGVVLPVGGVLAVVGGIWLVIALRRSRRNGERFLPMLYYIPN